MSKKSSDGAHEIQRVTRTKKYISFVGGPADGMREPFIGTFGTHAHVTAPVGGMMKRLQYEWDLESWHDDTETYRAINPTVLESETGR